MNFSICQPKPFLVPRAVLELTINLVAICMKHRYRKVEASQQICPSPVQQVFVEHTGDVVQDVHLLMVLTGHHYLLEGIDNIRESFPMLQ